MRIGSREIAPDEPPYVIAEIGVNHDGSIERAIELVHAARRADANAVKLQLFEASRLLSSAARLAAYQVQAGASDASEMLGSLELSVQQMDPIVHAAHELELHAIVSVFSIELVADADSLPWDAYKVASPDVINQPLIEAMVSTGRPLLISTGAASASEVSEAARWIGEHPHIFLQCVSAYPVPDDHAALAGRAALARIDADALGYSDHTTSIDTGALAVAAGARLLERHLTWSRQAVGPDHAASLEPETFAEYVRLARRAARMCGRVEKRVLDIEHDVRQASRQSVTAARDLHAGHTLCRDDVTIKRPGVGISPSRMEAILGRRLTRFVEADAPLTEEHLA